MKKVKKNNKPLIILIVGFLVFGSLFGYSIFRVVEHRKFITEDRDAFDKKVSDEKKSCDDIILSNPKVIDELEKEMLILQRKQSQFFSEDWGFSDRYYEVATQIKEKQQEISSKRKEISDCKTTLWKIENEFDGYRYKHPGFKKGNPYILLFLSIVGGIVTCICAAFANMSKVLAGEKSFSEYEEINVGTLSQADINDGVLLKKELFSKLQSLLKASSIEDYDTIRKLCTKNMAKSYIDEIELLKKHKQKLVISDVENKGTKIVSAHKTQRNTRVVLVQKIKAFNYTKDVTNNEVINGSDKNKSEQAFKLVFVKDYVTGHSVKQCPNCGASVKDATRVDCQYCGTVFDNSNYDWYLESKVIISEE